MFLAVVDGRLIALERGLVNPLQTLALVLRHTCASHQKPACSKLCLGIASIGAAYWNGDGVEKNLEECVFWYELATNGGDAQAQFATGWFLMTGTGVPQDERKGLKWIHKATFQGYQPAIDYCKEHGYKWY